MKLHQRYGVVRPEVKDVEVQGLTVAIDTLEM